MTQLLIKVAQIHIKSLQNNILAVESHFQQALEKNVDLLIMPAFTISDVFKSIEGKTLLEILEQLSKMTCKKKTAFVLGVYAKPNFEPCLYVFKEGYYKLIKSPFMLNQKLIYPHLNNKTSFYNADLEIIAETSGEGIPIINPIKFKQTIYINQIGCDGEIIFSGKSLIAIDSNYRQFKEWKEETEVCLLPPNNETNTCNIKKTQRTIDSIYNGLIFSIKNYLEINQFLGVILGMSGGIDSALIASLATKAIGSENVKAFMLPSQYTSQTSFNDAYECCKRLNIEIETIEINNIYDSYITNLNDIFAKYNTGVTEENLQARIRGTLLMAISNKTGRMLLCTGNKSEFLVGYSTLYGDMCGGFAPIKHIYKTDVFLLAKFINKINDSVIPQNIIIKAPTAELKHNQTDQDILPPYEILDSILKLLMNEEKGLSSINIESFNSSTINFVRNLYTKSAYKRIQSPLGSNLSKYSYEIY